MGNQQLDNLEKKQKFEKAKGGEDNPFLKFHRVHSFTIHGEITGELFGFAMFYSQVLRP
jgi:hypothetical protein